MYSVLAMVLGLQVVVFVVIVFLLRRFVLRDTLHAVERVKQVEAEVGRKEESVRRQVEEHEREFERRKDEMEADLARRRGNSEREVAQMKESIVAEARKEGDEILARAKRSEDKLKEDMRREVQSQAVDFAGEIFRLTFSEKVTAAVNREFIAELIGALEAVDSESLHVEADEARFVSSHPLEPAQRDRLQGLIAQKFGLNVAIHEEVDESLMGGRSMKLGTLEVDGSLRNRFQEASAEVKKAAGIS